MGINIGQVDPQAMQKLLFGGPQSLLTAPPDEQQPTPQASAPPDPGQAPQPGAIAQAMPQQPQSAAPPPQASQPGYSTTPPSFDEYHTSHGDVPVSAPAPAPKHGMLAKILLGVGEAVGNPYAREIGERDRSLSQQNQQFQQNKPAIQYQANRGAYEQDLGNMEKVAETRGKNVHADVEAQNLPLQERAAQVHDELAKRWQDNIDPDQNSFQQFAQQRLGAEPFAIQRMLNGDPQRGLPSPVQGITQLPRQPFSFDVKDGAIQPKSYRGANFGVKPSANEPPEVTAARDNALATIKQGQSGKIAVAKVEAQNKNQINLGNFGQAGDPMVDMVGQGRVDLQSALQRVPPAAKESFMSNLNQKYPGFQQSTYGIGKNVGEAFTAGPQGQQLTAINTAREHMKTFSQLADALDNNDTQVLNRIGNAFGVQFGSDKATNFKIASQAFGGEVGKAFSGSGVTEGERNSASAAFNPNMSPQQFRGAVKTVDSLLAGKQKALKQSYDSGKQGKPAFGNESGGGGGSSTANDPLGIR